MGTSVNLCDRLTVSACGSLLLAACALVAARLPSAAPVASSVAGGCSLALIVAALHIWRTGRRLAADLRRERDGARRSASEMQVALDNMAHGLVLCSKTAHVVAVNERFLTLFGIPADRIATGMPVADLIRLQVEAGGMPSVVADALVAERLSRQPGSSGQVVMSFKQGEFHIAYQPRPEGGWACTFEDVTAKREAERRLAFLAHHDPLTELPNRLLFRERLDRAVAAKQPFAVMFLDLDHFKPANDRFGHAVGDGLLRAVADRLRSCLPDGDTCARLGGDEFAVIVGAPSSFEDVERQAAHLVQSLAQPYGIDGHTITIGASIGLAWAGARAGEMPFADSDTLMREADAALYRAKTRRGSVERHRASGAGALAA